MSEASAILYFEPRTKRMKTQPNDYAAIEKELRAYDHSIKRGGYCRECDLIHHSEIAMALRNQLLVRNIDTILSALAIASKPRISELKKLVAEQAEDDGLWFDTEFAAEAYLQSALRQLHQAIEEA